MIRQSPSLSASTGDSISVYIKTSYHLIGETWYAPGIEITNRSGALVTVASVELIAGRITYLNTRTETFPLTLAPGTTKATYVWFDLQEDVKRAFRQSTVLRVHYQINHKDTLAESGLIGGSLDTSLP